MEVKKVLVSAFLLTTCLMSGQAQRRNEIQVPDLDGYTTLKCDFHMHSVRSRPFFDCRVESYSTSGFRSSIGRCGHSFKVCGYGAFAGV